MLTTLAPHLVNGIALGLLFALLALGFMLIVGLMETINLAHGSFFALGAYVALMIVAPPLPAETAAGWLALPLAVRYAIALVLAPAIVGVLGMVLELALRRTYGKDPLYALLLTFGAAIVIEEAIRAIWGSRERVLPTAGRAARLGRYRRLVVCALPLLRSGCRGAGNRRAVAFHRAHVLWRKDQGRLV